MLVLSRKETECLVIDENIVLTIVRISGGNVRIGIEAPPSVLIRRDELVPADRLDQSRISGPSKPPSK